MRIAGELNDGRAAPRYGLPGHGGTWARALRCVPESGLTQFAAEGRGQVAISGKHGGLAHAFVGHSSLHLRIHDRGHLADALDCLGYGIAVFKPGMESVPAGVKISRGMVWMGRGLLR
jgi:hypothetical protein